MGRGRRRSQQPPVGVPDAVAASYEKAAEAKADAERATFLDPQTGAAEIERRMRAEIKYQDGTLLIGQDGFPLRTLGDWRQSQCSRPRASSTD
jgi:hypothetical protein